MGDYPTDHRSPWLDENGFLRVRTGSDRRTRTAVEADLVIASSLTTDGPRKTIWDARAATTMDMNIWAPLIHQLPTIVSAMAALVSDDTSPQGLMFRKRVNTLQIPTRSFQDEAPAVAWLQGLEI